MFFHLDQTAPPHPPPLTPVTSEEVFRAVSELSMLGQLQSPSIFQHSPKQATTVELPQLDHLQLDSFINPLLGWWDRQDSASGVLPSRLPTTQQATTRVVSRDNNAWGDLGTFLSGPSLRECSQLPFLAQPPATLLQQDDNSRKEALSLLSCANINAWIMQFVSSIADSTEVATASLDMAAILRHIRTLSKAALLAVRSALNSATIQALKARHQCRRSALQSVDPSV